MSAKIQIKSDLVGTFGGIFLMLDHFGKANLDKLINKSLGDRRFNAKYSYSDIFKTLLATYTTNGSCIEDSRRISRTRVVHLIRLVRFIRFECHN